VQHPKRRYSFQCLNPDCRRNQTRWVRRGTYVTCGECGARNPGPATLAQAFQVRPPEALACSA